jgi:hypothetical protein
MKRVLLLATTTGYQIRSFGEAAEKLGVQLVFASDRCDQLDDPWWDHAIPIRFHDERQSVSAVLASFAGTPPEGIVAVGDRPAVLAARMAEALGIRGNPPAAARDSRSKVASRRAFKSAGLPTPWFYEVPIFGDATNLAKMCRYPAVIKPLALSGSRGVMRVDNTADFVIAFDRLRRLLQSSDIVGERDAIHERVLVEAYVPGNEFAIEGVLTDGTLRVFTIFDKPDPLIGPFFEETIYITPSRASQEVQKAIEDHIAAAVRAVGLRHGPVHAECRVNTQGVYVLEVAPRPIGGLCSRAVRFQDAGGSLATLEDVLLRHAIGENISSCSISDEAHGVMMIPIPRRGIYRGVSGLDEARAVNGVEGVQVTAKADEVVVPLPEGRSYLGFIFASGGDPYSVEQALRTAHGKLTFAIDRDIVLASSAH